MSDKPTGDFFGEMEGAINKAQEKRRTSDVDMTRHMTSTEDPLSHPETADKARGILNKAIDDLLTGRVDELRYPGFKEQFLRALPSVIMGQIVEAIDRGYKQEFIVSKLRERLIKTLGGFKYQREK